MVARNGKSNHLVARGDLRAGRPQTTTLSGLYHEVLDAAIEIADADMGVLHLFDEEHECLRLAASRQCPEGLLAHFSIVRTDADTSCAAAFRGRSRAVSTSRLRSGPELDVMSELGVAEAHSTPIIGASGIIWAVITMNFRAFQTRESYDPGIIDRIGFELASCLDRLANSDFPTHH
jgi:hypothetical protein